MIAIISTQVLGSLPRAGGSEGNMKVVEAFRQAHLPLSEDSHK